MTTNRSIPTNTILPHLVYRNVADAILWLSAHFGFTEHYRYGPPTQPQGAQIHLGGAYIMLESLRTTPLTEPIMRLQYLTIFVEDVTAHYNKAKSLGCKIVEPLNETVYGERQYMVEDFEGHNWLFSQHIRDMNPSDWGAILFENNDRTNL